MEGSLVANKQTGQNNNISPPSQFPDSDLLQPKMALTKPEIACDNVMQTLKVSRLTFSVKETPYSCYISIHKKFLPKSELSNLEVPSFPSSTSEANPSTILRLRELESETQNLCDTIDNLKKTCERKESEISALSLVKKIAESSNQKLQFCLDASKVDNEKLKEELEAVERDWKSLNKATNRHIKSSMI